MDTNDQRKDSVNSLEGKVQHYNQVKYCGLKAKPALKDIQHLKGAITELAVVTALFFASLAGGDFNVIIGLSITVTVLATFLILWDFFHIRKTRDYRISTLTLISLDVFVFIASCITLHYWRMMLNGNVGNNSLDSLYALDALMLALMILIVYGRIYFKGKKSFFVFCFFFVELIIKNSQRSN